MAPPLRRHGGPRAGGAGRRARALVLTTPDGVPFVQDGLRDGEHVREPVTDGFRAALAALPAPWIEAVGDRRSRVDEVMAWLDIHH